MATAAIGRQEDAWGRRWVVSVGDLAQATSRSAANERSRGFASVCRTYPDGCSRNRESGGRAVTEIGRVRCSSRTSVRTAPANVRLRQYARDMASGLQPQ